ncbi:NAD-dependent epimerase/dehydratase family protein [Nonomuraea recticatena]|uniref:NAD-dependent epimerase/dehydratase family protein n=1 Tax=Nonomuraea recticatena TaxID=46178 RepID=A0ABP6EH47_9ACTN
MNVLIIGASGYIGSAVAAALAKAGHRTSALRADVPGDLRDPSSLESAAKGFDLVVHAGPPLGEEADLAGVDALLASGAPLLHTTGAAVLGGGLTDEDSEPDPHPLVSWRAEAERRVLAAGGRVIRPGLVYGNAGGLVHDLLAPKSAERGAGVYIGEPGVRWPVVHVEDLAALYVAVAERAAPGTVWHGMSETVRLDALAGVLGDGRTASWPVEEAAAELGRLADLFTRDQQVSSEKTRRILGWRPAHPTMLGHLVSEGW